MLVSIITVSYNSEKTIARTIESVLNQTYPEIEYIIIDANSSDSTVEIINEYKEKFDRAGKKLIIVSEPDKGMYDGLNKGAKYTTGELVGQINADDWYETDAVETMVNLYEKNHFDVAWGNIRIIKKTGNIIKRAKIGIIWSTRGWCHPAMFSQRNVLISHPYALESMYDDFDFITSLYVEHRNLITVDKIISNFSFGGMSTQKSIKEVKRRIDLTYRIYRKYGMSKIYFFDRIIVEMIKYITG